MEPIIETLGLIGKDSIFDRIGSSRKVDGTKP